MPQLPESRSLQKPDDLQAGTYGGVEMTALICSQGRRQRAALVLLPEASPGLYVTETSSLGRSHVAR